MSSSAASINRQPTVRSDGGNSNPRHTAERLVIDPRHYEGESTDRVLAPPPLGRMGRAMMALANTPVTHRSIDLYARLAEVAR